MKDKNKTKNRLIQELIELRRQIKELEASKNAYEYIKKQPNNLGGEFTALFKESPIGVYKTNSEGKILMVNPALVKMLGYSSSEELKKRNLEKTGFHPEYPRLEFKRKIEREGKILNLESSWRRKDGKFIEVVENAFAVFDESGKVLYYEGIVEDITERKQTEEALRETHDYLENLFNYANAPIIVWDTKFRIVRFNHAFEYLTGYKADEVISQDLHILFPEESRNESLHKIKLTLEGEYWESVEIPILHKNGEIRFILWNSANIYTEDGTTLLATIAQGMDITKRKQQEEIIKQLAYHDVLTGLPNRILFNDRFTLALTHAQRNKQNLTIMFLDLDHFKDINDQLGHTMGDQLLKSVGYRLKNLLRKSDTVSRMGGDEFMLLLLETTCVEDTAKIANKILKTIRKPLVINEHELRITTSIGIVIYPNDGKNVDTLMKNVDIAMYLAKEKGRNNYQYFSSVKKHKRQK